MDIRTYPDIGNPLDIDCLVTHTLPQGLVQSLPNLKLLYAVGAGVDYLLAEALKRPDIRVARIADEAVSGDVASLAVAATLSWVRQLMPYVEQEKTSTWAPLPHRSSSETTVGILGMGRIGGTTATSLHALGFRVCGWSRTGKNLPGVQAFSGQAGLKAMLPRAQVLICTLPLTDETAGIVSADVLASLPQGAYFVNVGRGAHVDEDALLEALNADRLAGAFLDVFKHEPLPPAHPFWVHPRVRVTPHVASRTPPHRVAPQVIANVLRLRAGEPLMNLVDAAAGY
ncbi:glyoxylate/hydroxypyruvate reductase A [Variovorax paradoxus]|nr:glyoxylate/hydroxypyruvate reductase A [Variovorax paradoxus]